MSDSETWPDSKSLAGKTLLPISILTTGSCALPNYDLSAALHFPMVQAFHRHITRLGHDPVEFPVT